MNRTVRTAVRPPPMKLRPFHEPDCRVNGASPASVAIFLRSRVPGSGSSASSARETISSTPGTGDRRSSASRQAGGFRHRSIANPVSRFGRRLPGEGTGPARRAFPKSGQGRAFRSFRTMAGSCRPGGAYPARAVAIDGRLPAGGRLVFVISGTGAARPPDPAGARLTAGLNRAGNAGPERCAARQPDGRIWRETGHGGAVPGGDQQRTCTSWP